MQAILTQLNCIEALKGEASMDSFLEKAVKTWMVNETRSSIIF